MAKRVGVDKWLFFTTLSLVVVGLAWCFLLQQSWRRRASARRTPFFGRQALWALLGVVAMVVLDAGRLPTLQLEAIYLRRYGHHLAAAAGGLCRSRLARHAPLDSLRPDSSLFSLLKSPSPCWRFSWPGFCIHG